MIPIMHVTFDLIGGEEDGENIGALSMSFLPRKDELLTLFGYQYVVRQIHHVLDTDSQGALNHRVSLTLERNNK